MPSMLPLLAAISSSSDDTRYFSETTIEERLAATERLFEYWRAYFVSRPKRFSLGYRPFWTVGLPWLLSSTLLVLAVNFRLIATGVLVPILIGGVTSVLVLLVQKSDGYSRYVEMVVDEKVNALRKELAGEFRQGEEDVLFRRIEAAFSEARASGQTETELIELLRRAVTTHVKLRRMSEETEKQREHS